ncbi:MAG: GPW/gp25 family protein [Blastocatellia bacterium]
MADDSTTGKEFLGAGVAFPFGVSADGRIAMNSLEDHVRQSILLILQTARGERVMRPEFGAGLQNLAFEPLSPATATLARHQVEQALVRFEPRIEVRKVEVTLDPKQEGVLLINVEYRVRRTDTTFNLVYPFYLERGVL